MTQHRMDNMRYHPNCELTWRRAVIAETESCYERGVAADGEITPGTALPSGVITLCPLSLEKDGEENFLVFVLSSRSPGSTMFREKRDSTQAGFSQSA